MFCNYPFDMMHVLERAYMTCCYGWFDQPEDFVVRGDYDNLWEVWNHEKFKRLRSLWINGDFEGGYPKECSPCGKRIEAGVDDDILDYYSRDMTKGPKVIGFSNDLTCNLHCWTCRAKPIIEKKQKKVWKQTNNVLNTWKKDIRFIECIGSGDPFASPAWFDILQNIDLSNYHQDFRIVIFTNGLLLPTHWGRISNIHSSISRIRMSIDAVSKDIYERTRLGGKWEDLNRALDFVSEMDQPLTLNMVVTADNFTDIPLVIKKAISIPNCIILNITTMRYWPQMRGGYERFHEMDLSREDHPKMDEFIKVLNENKDLLNNPIVQSERLMPEHQEELVRKPSLRISKNYED